MMNSVEGMPKEVKARLSKLSEKGANLKARKNLFVLGAGRQVDMRKK